MNTKTVETFIERHERAIERVKDVQSALSWMRSALATPDDKTSKAAHATVEFQQGLSDAVAVGIDLMVAIPFFEAALVEAEATLADLNDKLASIQSVLGKGGAA